MKPYFYPTYFGNPQAYYRGFSFSFLQGRWTAGWRAEVQASVVQEVEEAYVKLLTELILA